MLNFLYDQNKYINLEEKELIKNKYKNHYKKIKNKIIKTSEEKDFIKYYKNIDKYIEINNEKYIKEKQKITPTLNNINGYPLDEYQSKVVLSNEKNTLVIAGAGSGKSLTIIGKIVYLTKCCNISPEEILCISFTNDATNNLKNNLQKNYNLNIDIYTFHKLSLKILKDNNYKFNISQDDTLDIIIDNFFDNNITQNKLFKKTLEKLTKNNELKNIKKLIKTFICLFKSNNYDISYFLTILKKIKTINIKEYYTNKNLLLFIINIYIEYEKYLEEESLIDFDDMINKSIKSIKKDGLKNNWKYVIVDEFQDTSLVKFNLLKEILNKTNAKFLAVGDDFQSIYRFTGCNLNIFLNFDKYLPYTKTFQIINTYRNPQELINVSGKFIMKNKYQQKKELISNKKIEYPIKIIYANNNIKTLKRLLIELNELIKDILVLGRNNKDINYYIDKSFTKVENDYYIYQNIKFKYLTMHRSKGLESENVIIINMINSNNGMPSKIKSEKILNYINNNKDYYPYEEERRLFYVALTRTKNYVYIITNKNESIFIKEILKEKKYVETKK